MVESIDRKKWPFHDAQVGYRGDKLRIYNSAGIYEDDMRTYGDPIEIIQGYLLYLGTEGTPYPSVNPKWDGGGCDGATLDIDFEVKSLSNKNNNYNLLTKLNVIETTEEPYLVEINEELSSECKCRQSDFIKNQRYPNICHHKIAVRMWLERFLPRYTRIRKHKKHKNLEQLKHVYKLLENPYFGEDGPWYVKYSLSDEVLYYYNSLTEKRADALTKISVIAIIIQDMAENNL